jgi:hypothetical protein
MGIADVSTKAFNYSAIYGTRYELDLIFWDNLLVFMRICINIGATDYHGSVKYAD